MKQDTDKIEKLATEAIEVLAVLRETQGTGYGNRFASVGREVLDVMQTWKSHKTELKAEIQDLDSTEILNLIVFVGGQFLSKGMGIEIDLDKITKLKYELAKTLKTSAKKATAKETSS
jgi:hypothetical protein